MITARKYNTDLEEKHHNRWPGIRKSFKKRVAVTHCATVSQFRICGLLIWPQLRPRITHAEQREVQIYQGSLSKTKSSNVRVFRGSLFEENDVGLQGSFSQGNPEPEQILFPLIKPLLLTSIGSCFFISTTFENDSSYFY